MSKGDAYLLRHLKLWNGAPRSVALKGTFSGTALGVVTAVAVAGGVAVFTAAV
jgi:hypothetical protein